MLRSPGMAISTGAVNNSDHATPTPSARMFRASHSRALAELGLIRIAMLDELDDLREAIEELRSEQSVPADTRSTRSSSRAREAGKRAGTPAPPATQKKTVTDSTATVDPPSSPEHSPPTMEFRAGNESQLWAQVVEQISDAVRTHVQAVSSVAISGPNRLDLTFPKSYSFSRQFCERPEVSGRLSEIISQLTGQAPQIVCKISESPSEDEPDLPETIEEKPASNSDVVEDPFVQQAVAVFEATVVKVDGISTPR